MVLCEDGECSVCFFTYSRMDRIPRVLHCRHTFCEPCLEMMSQVRSSLLTIPCPLCRRVTCIGRGLSVQEALWVNHKLWEQIPEDGDAEEEEEEGQTQTEKEMTAAQPSLGAERITPRSSATKLKLSAFFRRFSLRNQPQESIIPGSNVEIKSWRRLTADETF